MTDMMADSPVTFPEKGPLPPLFPPDHPSERPMPPPEEDYFLFTTPERSPEQILSLIMMSFFRLSPR